jgi:hypothetical protein
MKKLYYLIWVDFITSARKNHPERTDWKYSLFVLITMCNALNLYTFFIWLMYLGKVKYLIKIDIFPGTIINAASSFLIQFASPFILLNYFLIFYHDRYEKLIEKYPNKKGRLALIYSICSIWIGVISMIFYGILTNNNSYS